MTVSNVGPILFESVSAVTATPSVEVGTVRREGNEEYIYVYNAGNSQANPGYGLTASGVTGYSLTVSTTTMIDHVFAVVKHATLTTGTYGWALTKGFCSAKMPANSGCAAGQLLTVGADGVFAVKSIATDAPGGTYGKVMVATASAGVATAFFKLY